MFKNMGKKIKTLAQVMMWIGVAIWSIGGLVMIVNGLDVIDRRSDEGMAMIFGGLLVAGLGFLFSWIGSFLLYGFGQLVDNSDKTVRILQEHTGISGDPAPVYAAYTQPQYGQPQYGQPQYAQPEAQPQYTTYTTQPENTNEQ